MPLIIREERDDRAYQAKPFGGSHKCSKLIALSMSAGEVVGLRDLACDPLTGASAHKGAGSLADLRGSCISTARSAIAPGGSSFLSASASFAESGLRRTTLAGCAQGASGR